MKINEKNFIKELKNKNPMALDYLVDNYSSLIFKVIISVLGSERREDAMECLNDVIFKSWKNIQYYHEEKSRFSSWLIAVSKHNAIDYKRKLLKIDENCNIDEIIVAEDKKLEDEIVEKENKQELLKIINEMGNTDKIIFIRRYFIGESIKEICESLKLSRTAVDNRIFRGKKLLKEKMIASRSR